MYYTYVHNFYIYMYIQMYTLHTIHVISRYWCTYILQGVVLIQGQDNKVLKIGYQSHSPLDYLGIAC